MNIYLPVFVSTHDVVRAHWQAVGLDLKNKNKNNNGNKNK